MKKAVSLFLSFLMVAMLLPLEALALELSELGTVQEESFAEDEIIFEGEDEVVPEETLPEEVPVSYGTEEIEIEQEVLFEDSPAVVNGFCGAEGNEESLAWNIDENGTLTISGIGRMQDFERTVDENGVQATTAPWYPYRESIKTIVFNEGISYIGYRAFAELDWIEGTLSLPEGLEEIGTCAFTGCGFTGELVLPTTLKKVYDSAFEHAGEFTGKLVIPEGMEYIGSYGFRDGAYSEIEIPATVTYIGEGAFSFNDRLEKITVAETNEKYCSENGVLFSKDKTILIQYANGLTDEYTVPETVETIGGSSFNVYSGEKVIIPATVKNIDGYAFYASRTTVVLDGAVETVGEKAFRLAEKVFFMNGAPETVVAANEGNPSFGEETRLYYLLGTEDKWTFDENGLWNGYEVNAFVIGENGEYLPAGYCGGEGDGKNLIWKIDSEGTLIIEGSGKMRDYDYRESAPWVKHSDIIDSLVIEEGVTSIGTAAFYINVFLEGNLIIPGTVQTIGNNAFSGCRFNGSLTIPDSVTSIGSSAFAGCFAFDGGLVIGNGIVTIGSRAFSGTGFKGNLIIGDNVETIGGYAFANSGFSGDLLIPDSVKSIQYNAFFMCDDFDGILVLGNGLKFIGSSAFAFSGFSGNLSIPGGVRTIGNFAFYNCENFDGTLTLREGLEKIGYGAFAESNFNGNLRIPNSVKELGSHAFRYCRNLDGELIIGKGIDRISPFAFAYTNFYYDVVIPENISSVENNAFRWCSAAEYQFEGNAPKVLPADDPGHSFDGDHNIVYKAGKSGWPVGSSVWNGYSVRSFTSGAAVEFNPADYVASGYCGAEPFGGKNVAWMLDSEGVLTIKGSGMMKNYRGELGINVAWSEYLGEVTDEISFEQNGPWKNFKNEVNKIVVENGVTNIGDFAFVKFANLERVELAESVSKIGNGAFIYCENLDDINLFEREKNIGTAAFAFAGISGEVNIADGYTVNELAFAATDVTRVSVAKNAQIGASAFALCSALEGIDVADEHLELCDVDGVLYDKKMSMLKQYPAGKSDSSYSVPYGIKCVGPAAFATAKLEIIDIPSTVVKIDEFAFAFCKTEELILPTGIETVENYAFLASKTSDVKFKGSAPEVAGIGHAAPSFEKDTTIFYCEDEPGWELDENGKWNGYNTEKWTAYDVSIVVDSGAFVAGRNGTVSVTISENSNAAMLQFALKYDPDVLTVVSCSAGEIVSEATINTGIKGAVYFAWDSKNPISTEGGEILNIEFTVAEDAASTQTYIGIDETEELVIKDPGRKEIRTEIIGKNIDILDVIYGDATGDGKVNVEDAYLVRLCAARIEEIDEKGFVSADVDGDGRLTAIDANYIRRYSVKLITEFPVEQN